LSNGTGPLTHGREAVTSRAEQIREPVTPMIGQRQGNLGYQNNMNSRFHAETVPTRLDPIASHGCPFRWQWVGNTYLAR
jgi:hypothetical protein